MPQVKFWQRAATALAATLKREGWRQQNSKAGVVSQTLQVRKRVVEHVADSDWSKWLGISTKFDVSTDWNKLPITSYDDIRPFAENLASGNSKSMFKPYTKVEMFTLSSGTTGNRKLLPMTKSGAAQVRSSWLDWGTFTYSDHPELFCAKICQLTSDWQSYHTPSGIPVGDVSGFSAKIQWNWLQGFYVIPECINKIGDQRSKYFICLAIMLCHNDFRLISTATPSTLLSLTETLRREKQELLTFLNGGSLPPYVCVSDIILKNTLAIVRGLSKSRLKALEILAKNDATFLPYMIWPNISVVSCWIGGTMNRHMSKIEELFAPQGLRDFGYVASEGNFTVPLGDRTSSGLLRTWDYSFEFLPTSSSRLDSSKLLQVSDLQVGEDYSCIVSTVNGLVRYCMRDIVRFEGWGEFGPTVKFMQKDGYFSDLTGEKISAFHCDSALAVLCRRFQNIRFGYVLPVVDIPFGYDLLIETEEICDEGIRNQIAEVFDQCLGEQNFIYKEHRDAGKLALPKVQLLASGANERFRNIRLKKSNGSPEQYKEVCLVVESIDREWLYAQVVS